MVKKRFAYPKGGSAEPQREVKALENEIVEMIARDELDFEFRMRIHELIESLPKAGDRAGIIAGSSPVAPFIPLSGSARALLRRRSA